MTGWKYYLLIFCSVAVLVALPYLYKVDQPFRPHIEQYPNEDHQNETELRWGINSANLTTVGHYRCVREQFGTPMIWGRYLGDNENVSDGLTINEINFLHDNGHKILLIYNQFTDATGYENGQRAAEHAISLAQSLHVPYGKAIFAEIEPSYPIDSEFLGGWYEGMQDSMYIPAIHGSFLPGHELDKMYKRLANTNENFRKKMILWTAYPQTEPTASDQAPDYLPTGPDDANIVGWQYGIDAKSCHIDTNLFTTTITDYVW